MRTVPYDSSFFFNCHNLPLKRYMVNGREQAIIDCPRCGSKIDTSIVRLREGGRRCECGALFEFALDNVEHKPTRAFFGPFYD